MNTNLAKQTQTAQLARSFSRGLARTIGAANLSIVRSRNAIGRANVCASHDFCDANMVMDSAFRRVIGRAIDLQSDADCALWDSAWSAAKRAGFQPRHVV